MTIRLSDLDILNLDADAVQARRLRMVDTIESEVPGLEVRDGFIADYVVRLASILWEAADSQTDRIAASLNPLIVTDATIVEPDVLSASAANFGLTRYTATSSFGQIRVVMSSSRSIVIPRGAVFTAPDGTQVTTSEIVTSRTSATELVSDSDVLVTSRTDGNYEFTFNAQSVRLGSGSSIIAGTLLTPTGLAIAGLIRIEVASEFSGGIAAETDQQLLSRMRRQQPAKTPGTAASVVATMTSQENFPQWLSVNVTGYGDPEFVRTRRDGFTVGVGADVWIRPQTLPIVREIELLGTVTEVTEVATVQVAVPREVFPGFYRVISAAHNEQNLLITGVTYQRDGRPLAGQRAIVMQSAVDSAFTAFQTATITLSMPTVGLSEGDDLPIDVRFLGMPDVLVAQQVIENTDYRFAAGDTLVHAAIPAMVSMTVTISAQSGVTVDRTAEIKDALAAVINSQGFVSKLRLSRLTSVIYNQLPQGADVSHIEAVVETLLPDGTNHRSRSKEEIVVPYIPGLSVSGQTTVFICDPSNIALNIYREDEASQ
jgi:hypothetical protein